MAEEELVAAAASPAPPDLKRKHEDLESEAPQPPAADSHENGSGSGNGNGNGNENENGNEIENKNENENENENEIESDSAKRDDGEEGEEVAEASAGGDADESEAKRPRLEEKPDALVTQNGFQEEKIDEPLEETAERPAAENNTESEDALQPAEEALETVKNELPSSDDHMTGDIQPPSVENPQLESAQKQLFGGELQEPSTEVPPQGDFSSAEEQFASETQTMSQKMEVPNNKVGVLIGKSGDTIRFLQLNSGAKIQITRDADADPYSATRLVELIGTMESVNKAERLIKDVIAEADAGGSPSLVARGFNTVQAAGAVEQILIQVPNEKVGLIIGKGGENIKNLQTRSGARIQLIPQHLPEGDQSKERTVRVSGEKKQIEMAREMIKEVMSQIWLLPSSWGQHFLLGVAINNHYSLSIH
ncbi:hypothetical protein U1Q18_016591 [Sarracenia purpurea var. burkii]